MVSFPEEGFGKIVEHKVLFQYGLPLLIISRLLYGRVKCVASEYEAEELVVLILCKRVRMFGAAVVSFGRTLLISMVTFAAWNIAMCSSGRIA